MKKALMILALLATGMCARAQVDTLHKGEREPTYYYWDTNWWDYPAINDPAGIILYWEPIAFQLSTVSKPEFARYCYTDSSLRVIGVAVSMDFSFRKLNGGDIFNQTPDSILVNNMVTEYFRLYEVDSTTDEMVLLAQGPWNSNMQPRYYMECSYNGVTNPPPLLPPYVPFVTPVYEVYFDSAVTVYDSFYVAVTGNNNYNRMEEFASIIITGVRAYDLRGEGIVIPNSCKPNPNHFRRKLHYFDASNYDFKYEITDTNWHTIATYSNRSADTCKPVPWDQFSFMFPIIDTSRIIPPPACHTPNGLTTVYAEAGVATLMWSGGNADHWELSLCTDGCEPEEGSITQWNTLAATLQGLDTARWYEARVRAVCSHDDSIYYSDWSDSLRFYMPGGNGGSGGGTDPTGIETTADRYTYVMPNPASGNVTVASSFRIGDVELLDLNGKSHLRATVDGLSAALDISSLPAGTYIVRITTSAGTAYKKLVVK